MYSHVHRSSTSSTTTSSSSSTSSTVRGALSRVKQTTRDADSKYLLIISKYIIKLAGWIRSDSQHSMVLNLSEESIFFLNYSLLLIEDEFINIFFPFVFFN